MRDLLNEGRISEISLWAFFDYKSRGCQLLTGGGLLSDRMNTLRLAAAASPGFACPEREAETGWTCIAPETLHIRIEAFSRFLNTRVHFRKPS